METGNPGPADFDASAAGAGPFGSGPGRNRHYGTSARPAKRVRIDLEAASDVRSRLRTLYGKNRNQEAEKLLQEGTPPWLQPLASGFADLTELPVPDAAQRTLLSLPEPDLPEVLTSEDYARIYHDPVLFLAVRHAMLRTLWQNPHGIEREQMFSLLPDGTPKPLFDELERRLMDDGVCIRWGTLLQPSLTRVLDFVNGLQSRTNRELLLDRMKGSTLELAGWRQGYTKQRASDRIKKVFQKAPPLLEDRYLPITNRYEFSSEDLQLAYGEPLEIWYYLEMRRPRGSVRKPLSEILEDETVPVTFRRRAERAIFKDIYELDGVRVALTKQSLIQHAMRKFCQESTPFSEFTKKYAEMLEGIETLTDEDRVRLRCEGPGAENRLMRADFVLCSRRHKMRYYPIGDRDYTNLLDVLGLERMQDVDISTQKFMNDYPELMRDYDIRNAGELHNLLRKIWPGERSSAVEFIRMPNIKIGNPDRGRQVMDLLKQYAPITATEMALRYEEAYGVDPRTFAANFGHYIQQYMEKGKYRIPTVSMTDEQRARMKELLTEDFYLIVDVQEIFQREFPEEDEAVLNSVELHRLGYHIRRNFIMKEEYVSGRKYMDHLIAHSDFLDLNRSALGALANSFLYNEFQRAKANYDVVEVETRMYVTRRYLLYKGIRSEDIRAFCDAVHAFVEPGACFTYESLIRDGFENPLQDRGFGPSFFAALLQEDRERFSYQRLGGNRILRNSPDGVSLSYFVSTLLGEKECMSIDDLHGILKNRYEIILSSSRLAWMMHGTDMYYDAANRLVFRSEDAFLRSHDVTDEE